MELGPRRTRWYPLVWIGVIIVVDQLSKRLVLGLLGSTGSIPILGEYFRLTLARNPGGAFGILAEQGALLTVLTVGVTIGILFVLWQGRLRSPWVIGGLIAIAGGALGNLIDRIKLGYVIDFFDVGISTQLRWPTFNVADAAIVMGTALLLWRLLRREVLA